MIISLTLYLRHYPAENKKYYECTNTDTWKRIWLWEMVDLLLGNGESTQMEETSGM